MQRPDTEDGLFHAGDPLTGQKGTPITADWLNALLSVGALFHGEASPPPPELGDDGDHYLNASAQLLFGPKAAGAWPAGVSLKGETGATGLTGNPYKTYATKALATADLANIPADALIWVNADATAAYNGYYAKTGGVLVKSLDVIPDGSLSFAKMASAFVDDMKRLKLAADVRNFLSLTTLTSGGEISHTTGEVTVIAGYYYTGFVPVIATVAYAFRSLSDANYLNKVAFYDGSFVFISGALGSNSFVAPAGAVYARASVQGYKYDAAPAQWFFGTNETYKQRIASDNMANRPEIHPRNFSGGVAANHVTAGAYIAQDVLQSMVTPTMLLSSILERASENLLDLTTAVLLRTLNAAGEPVVTGASTGYIDVPCQQLTEYSLTTGIYGISFIFWYDADWGFLSAVTTTASPQHTAPAGAYFMRCFINYSNQPMLDKQVMVVKGGVLPSTFIPHSSVYKLKSEFLPGAKAGTDWSGKVYVALGDSRTVGYNSNPGSIYPKAHPDVAGFDWCYPQEIEYQTGITLVNRGSAGTAWARRVSLPSYPIMYDHIVGNVGLEITPISEGTDIVTIHAGTNDRPVVANPTTSECLWDNAGDLYDVTTFKGAIRATLKALRINFSTTAVVLLADSYDAEKNAAIVEIANAYRYPVLKLYEISQTTAAWDAESTIPYYADALHESVLGQVVVGRAVGGEMKKHLW